MHLSIKNNGIGVMYQKVNFLIVSYNILTLPELDLTKCYYQSRWCTLCWDGGQLASNKS